MSVLGLISFGVALTIFLNYPSEYLRTLIDDEKIADYTAIVSFIGGAFLLLAALFGTSKKIDLFEIKIWAMITFFGCLGYYVSSPVGHIETLEIKNLFHKVSVMLVGIAYMFIVGRQIYLSLTPSNSAILNSTTDNPVEDITN